ncbi:uncharacterized protein LOC131994311 [Stomoxys calcitrans]|uniref:uncharacterized protein LOC131994311 n=1 Tax=Stomoxys calcitrans TaxID=35570 RepID=UPI0027E309AE|nr:uncharacterized protein LOC131994311 [Stomoxys calcitrans]
MRLFLQIYLIVFLIMPYLEGAKKKPRNVYILETKYDVNKEYVKRLEVNISDNKTSISILFETKQVFNELWASLAISSWQKQTNIFRPIITYDIELCDTLARIKSSNIHMLNTWVMNFLKYGNLSSTCPFEKNLYYFENWKIEKDSIPAFAPNGKFRTYVKFYKKMADNSKEMIGNTEMTIELK